MGVLYSERLFVPWWWWLFVGMIVGSVALATIAYLPPLMALGWTLVVAIPLCWGLISYGRAKIIVTPTQLRVGSAHIDWSYTGAVTVLDEKAKINRMRSRSGRADYLTIRPYIPDAVVVEILDDADPYTNWLMSTRHPSALKDAIEEAQQASGVAGGRGVTGDKRVEHDSASNARESDSAKGE